MFSLTLGQLIALAVLALMAIFVWVVVDEDDDH